MVLPLLAISAATSIGQIVRQPPPDPSIGYFGVSTWINRNIPGNARIEAAEIGTLGFYCNRYLMDSLGLTLPKMQTTSHIAM